MCKILPMTGFKPRAPDVGSNCSANWTTHNGYQLCIIGFLFTHDHLNALATILANLRKFLVRKIASIRSHKSLTSYKSITGMRFSLGNPFVNYFACIVILTSKSISGQVVMCPFWGLSSCINWTPLSKNFTSWFCQLICPNMVSYLDGTYES